MTDNKLMFFVDFDGTITVNDICYTMVNFLAAEGWKELNRLWEQKVISTEECAQGTLHLMDVKPAELEEFFYAQELTPGFPTFVDWVRSHEYPLYILSDGYDNYIDIVLQRHGLEIEYYANHLKYDAGRWQFVSPYPDDDCQECGVCKKALIEQKLQPGYRTVYIGDGYSDTCPAQFCDTVFARDTLASYCEQNDIPYHPYQNFYQVLEQLQKGRLW